MCSTADVGTGHRLPQRSRLVRSTGDVNDEHLPSIASKLQQELPTRLLNSNKVNPQLLTSTTWWASACLTLQVAHSECLAGFGDVVYTWQRPANLPRILAPQAAPPVVILPGFGNCSSDYTAPFGLREEGIAHFLQVLDLASSFLMSCRSLAPPASCCTTAFLVLAAKRL